jgi:hypothetical protein
MLSGSSSDRRPKIFDHQVLGRHRMHRSRLYRSQRERPSTDKPDNLTTGGPT